MEPATFAGGPVWMVSTDVVPSLSQTTDVKVQGDLGRVVTHPSVSPWPVPGLVWHWKFRWLPSWFDREH